MTTLTAGWLMMNLRKYCAQLVMPSSAANGGMGWFFVFANSALRPKGRFTSTAVPVSRAVGSKRFSISRLSME